MNEENLSANAVKAGRYTSNFVMCLSFRWIKLRKPHKARKFRHFSQNTQVVQDTIWGLLLNNKRRNGFIEPVYFFFRKIETFPKRNKEFFVMTVGGFGIVIVFGLYSTYMPWVTAAIADIRSLLYLSAVFPFKTTADTVAAMTGAA